MSDSLSDMLDRLVTLGQLSLLTGDHADIDNEIGLLKIKILTQEVEFREQLKFRLNQLIKIYEVLSSKPDVK